MKQVIKQKVLLFAVLFLVLGVVGSLHADSITIDTISGNWSNPVGGGGTVSITPGATSLDVDEIRWGTGTNQSGYDWDATNTPLVVNTEVVFSLGEFSHTNFPISIPQSITSVDLDFEVGTFDSPTNLSATFLFDHNETPNDGADPRDIVTISNAFFNDTFTDGGNAYFFSLLGFSQDGGTTIDTQFFTSENTVNTTQLYAIITEEAIPTVPEPTTLVLLGTGLGALGLVARHRRERKR